MRQDGKKIMKHNLILFFVFIFLIAGCAAQEKTEKVTQNIVVNTSETKIENKSVLPAVSNISEKSMNDSQEEQNKTILNISQPVRLGNLCSGEEGCSNFCSNNRDTCEEYCKENIENSLCLKILPLEYGSEKVRQEDQTETTKKDNSPVLKNLGVNIEPWDKTTNRAGDFLFENKNYVDNKIFTEFANKIVNDMGEKLLPEIGFNVPVGTKIVSPIDGVITDVKFYEPSQDYFVSIKTDKSSPWIVGFEHVYNVRMKIGDKVLVGQELAEVSPSYGRTEFGNVEINVWTGGQNIIKYCPFNFLDDSLKPMYKEKLNRLARDWEEFVGEDVYEQEKWVAPGCLLHNITER